MPLQSPITKELEAHGSQDRATRLQTSSYPVESGLSAVLYHITNIFSASSILTKDRFELKPSDGTDVEEKIATSYYLSCARSTRSDYFRSSVFGKSVIFQLDGRKLSAVYKGAPVDYWGDLIQTNEMEDRVLAPTEFIPASKFITSVHCIFDPTVSQVNSYVYRMHQIKYRCALKKIPCVFYPNPVDLLTLSPKKQIKVTLQELSSKPNEVHLDTESDFKYRGRKSRSLAAWLALYLMPAPSGNDNYTFIKEKGWEQLGYIYRTLSYRDSSSQFKNDLHNAKSTPYDTIGKEREYLDKIIRVLRKEKWTPDEFFSFLSKKWYGR